VYGVTFFPFYKKEEKFFIKKQPSTTTSLFGKASSVVRSSIASFQPIE
jgi:hypothetical protein